MHGVVGADGTESRMEGLARGAVALGANLGDARTTLRSARAFLLDRFAAWGCVDVRFSGLWETEPVGPPQPSYLNAACTFSAPSTLAPLDVLAFLLDVEARHGRIRSVPLGPRTLDLDLLFLGDAAARSPALDLPHPRAHQRAFVLWPLVDADPLAVLPPHGSARALADALGHAGVRRVTLPGEPW